MRRALTQADVARLIGTTPATVSHWESGRREISLATLIHLAPALGMDPGNILTLAMRSRPRQDVERDALQASLSQLGLGAGAQTLQDLLARARADVGERTKWPKARSPVEAAQELLGGHADPPVDVHSLANACGLAVATVTLDAAPILRGLLYRDYAPVILVETTLSSSEARFTVARALGHWLLTTDSRYLELGNAAEGMSMPPSNPYQQLQLNEFAISLLLPSAPIRRLAKRARSVDELATQFDVDPLPMSLRVIQLGIQPFIADEPARHRQ